MDAERWGSGAKGRNHTVAFGHTVWTVANAKNINGNFDAQVKETLDLLDGFLRLAGSSRAHLLSVQVILADIRDRETFNEHWYRWVGDNPDQWPQRAVFGAALAPGLLVEITATAAKVGASAA